MTTDNNTTYRVIITAEAIDADEDYGEDLVIIEFDSYSTPDEAIEAAHSVQPIAWTQRELLDRLIADFDGRSFPVDPETVVRHLTAVRDGLCGRSAGQLRGQDKNP